MCYSAMVWADYRSYVRFYGAIISIRDFIQLFQARRDGEKISIPRAMADAFAEPENAQEREIKSMIDAYNQYETTRLEGEILCNARGWRTQNASCEASRPSVRWRIVASRPRKSTRR